MKEEELVSKIKDGLGKTSLSERTIREYGQRVFAQLPADAVADDALIGLHVENLKTLGRNLSADIAEQLRQQKEVKLKEWEDAWKAGRQDAVKADDAARKDSDAISSLRGEIEEMRRMMGEAQEGARVRGLRERLLSGSESLGVSNREVWQDCVNGMDVQKEDGYESLEKRAKNAYETKMRRYFGTGAKPYYGDVTGSGDAGTTAIDAFFARKASEGVFPVG